MAKIINLKINNFRGIQDLSLNFKRDKNLICLIGRGDSGKTTILEAVSSVLSSNWNLNFSDTDFYNCEHTKNIEIAASVVDFPENLLSDNKYGLHVRAFNTQDETITDDVVLEEIKEGFIPVLTIKLIVDSSLEPKWIVSNTREQEDKPISATDRSLLNCYLISDYVDRHFSWNKGNPLYSLLKSEKLNKDTDNGNIVIQHLRKAKEEIDKNDFESLDAVTELIKEQAAELGLDISKSTTTLDSRELLIKDGRISLHDDTVPFRQKGKGSKRLASIAIQSVLVRNGGIMLIDELEQGLEPDRVKQVVRSMKDHHAGQIFITTHSRDVITELGAEPLLFMLKDKSTDFIETRLFNGDTEDLQKAVRACPEAFFSKKVIICEGATEVGICRAMDKWRRARNKQQMAFRDCSYVDGTGDTIVQRVKEINEVGIDTALFCDSDLDKINEMKLEWIKSGVSVFDCNIDFCLERQMFDDLPWLAIQKLLDYVLKHQKKGDANALRTSIISKYPNEMKFPDNWKNSDTPDMRIAIAKASVVKKKEWFKAIHHGEALGDIMFDSFELMKDDNYTKMLFSRLSDWIDE
ncbi:MAG: AAA family ATPase [Alteromonadaceae bacterium]|nr:AAA family ATPase [Alteromonadaceae bacterium]